ncbi:MAG: SMP-30/gluconolactonase/LRE family protein [Betaproteobacteria bacterium]|jgi:gluconolactonase|nr:SMP-30/gluconolactonase/LRE family protein [Betaproteobacteria bacterium]NBP45383.1 SMP-30/gluconolactonase/LRE family protein [Betaproteobacteria bacterium]
MTHFSTDASAWQPSPRYPDPRVVSLDAAFNSLVLAAARVERLSTGHRWCEGPVWWGDARCLLWSDIPNNTICRWDEVTHQVSAWRSPSHFANGATRDRQGRILHCEHGGRRVVRTEPDGQLTVLADHFEGKRLNSPNDLVCKSDGSVWFTDPSFGILGFYEGSVAKPELPTQVYRWHETEGLSMVATDLLQPNGLAFSPDESILYVVESRAQPRRILAYDVSADGRSLSNHRILIDAGPKGTPDGFRVDIHGNLWCGWGMGEDGHDGVHVFNPQGQRIGRIDLPERCANLCFGGVHRNRLFMAASTSVYSLYVNTQGLAGG